MSLTNASLRHIQRMGAHLQTVHLPFTAGCTYAALARTLAQYDRGVTFTFDNLVCDCPTCLKRLQHLFTPCYDEQVARRQRSQGKAAGQKKRRIRCRISRKNTFETFCVEEY
eukprot:TRINITY_DN6523_c0_g1_i2.p2 TRINITY_DN6523_c0_g1~~TRINITY_DN6523_c0_g1_i2.p2  ORF type:complete len:112 (+),score=12.46 TRINITY_DN6523_c0_g1_i2:483-818(+)